MVFLGFQTMYLNNKAKNSAELTNGSAMHPLLLFIHAAWVLLGQPSHCVSCVTRVLAARLEPIVLAWLSLGVSLTNILTCTQYGRSGCLERCLKIKHIPLSFLKQNKCDRLTPAPVHQKEKKKNQKRGQWWKRRGRKAACFLAFLKAGAAFDL